MQRTQLFVHLEDRIHGAFHDACDIADDISHGHEVLVINALVRDGLLHRYQLAQGHERRWRTSGERLRQCIRITSADTQREQFLGRGLHRAWQLQHEVDVFFVARHMQQINGLATDRDAQRLRDRLGADAIERGLFFINDEARARLVVFEIPINVHHSLRIGEDLAHVLGQGMAGGFVGAVKFGDERLQHRRSRRHLGNGDARTEFLRDLGYARTHALGDVVALRAALVFAH